MEFFLEYAKQSARSFLGTDEVVKRDPSMHFHLRRDTTPSICYDDCNSAYKIGLSDGDNTDNLCNENGSFMQVYNICLDCVKDNSDSSKDSVEKDVQDEFKQFLDKCKDKGSATSVAADKKIVPSSACAKCATTVLTDYTGGHITVVLGTKTGAQTASLSNFFTVTRTVSTTETVRPGGGSKDDDGPSTAVIVGPVVPSVILLAAVAFFGFRWWKRRRTPKAVETPMSSPLPPPPPADAAEPEPKVEYKAQLPSEESITESTRAVDNQYPCQGVPDLHDPSSNAPLLQGGSSGWRLAETSRSQFASSASKSQPSVSSTCPFSGEVEVQAVPRQQS
ncbi:hypothetical protein NM208_g7662 [Fusarium decemcellulare]|uniref:Uncharacterized protein n=1 Tax=Fusarium decemcellulare TaxID=57161 RepID=A0ACC1S8F6_9HYPO|nr:hypothetical protein NM208_g7662 [Fusarium decemcellulare]